MSALGIDDEPQEAARPGPPTQPRPEGAVAAAAADDPERLLVSCGMIDPGLLHAAAHIPPSAMADPRLRKVWQTLQSGMRWGPETEGQFCKATGMTVGELLRLETAAGLGTGFSGWLREVEDGWRAREVQSIAVALTNPGADYAALADRLAVILQARRVVIPAEPLPDFGIPDENDPSVLLGDRYLNRGDGLVLSGTSGMGKSSIDLQMAVCWALGREFQGVRPNGPLRSLVIQSEDSRGDIAEVWVSLKHSMKLSDADLVAVRERVLVVTERVRRGQGLIDELRRLIGKHRPDLVHINPLQAFIDGDVTEARDIGDFLRGGLNGLNEPATHAYVIVHHTTKPSTGADRKDPAWSEVMYGMAGGAEIINWARAIIILKAGANPGEFTLVLAKRGIRAGVTRPVAQGAGVRDEPVTSIFLKHSTELIELPGRKRKLRAIFWEPREADPEEEKKASGKKPGRPRGHSFADYKKAFPTTEAAAAGYRRIHGIAKDIHPIGVSAFYNVINDGVADGLLGIIPDERGRPRYWLKP